MSAFKEAAFRDANGHIVGTGAFHDITSLPEGFEPADEGFLDHGGAFVTREEASASVGTDHPVQSKELDLCKSLKEYKFDTAPEEVGTQMVFRARHGNNVVGTLTIGRTAVSDGSPYTGYHKIGQADVHPLHRGNGVYGRLLQIASLHVKRNHGAKGLVSLGQWRSEKAGEAWSRLASKPKLGVQQRPGVDPDAPDFFMSEKLGKSEQDDATDPEYIQQEFDIEFRRWLELRSKGEDYTPPEEFSIAKAEAGLEVLAAKHGNLKTGTSADHHEVARQMAGLDPDYSPEFAAARFLAGGAAAPAEAVRAALILYDDDFELAALRAYGLPRNDKYRQMLRSAMEMVKYLPKKQELSKSGDLDVVAIPRDIKAVLPEGEDAAKEVRRAQAADAIEPVQFDSKAKHSKGTAIATDPETNKKWLLKPGSGTLSPSAGVREEIANQSQREVAFSKVAQLLGLGDFLPKAELLLVDGKEVAALELLGTDYKGLDKLRQSGDVDVAKLFAPYIHDGTLYKWAFLDWVLGNVDRHANNIMVKEDLTDVKLIDHGSAFAGPSFDPAHDPKSFTAFYLRAWSDGSWNDMTAEEREVEIPRLSNSLAQEFSDWVDSLDVVAIEQTLSKYGVSTAATMARLRKIVEAEPGERCDVLAALWAGALT